VGEEAATSSAGIKRLEKKRGRLWGFVRRGLPGVVSPLSPSMTTGRLRHLMTSFVKTMSSYVKNRMGEDVLRDMLEHQAEEFASNLGPWRWGAAQIAENLIRLNFQPLGMQAEYTVDGEAARIIVKSCPLPQRFLQNPELLMAFFESEAQDLKSLISLGESLTARGEWPPKTLEVCSLCKMVIPRVGKQMGFTWEHELTDDKPPICSFNIRITHNK
jgi:hypothetical protein